MTWYQPQWPLQGLPPQTVLTDFLRLMKTLTLRWKGKGMLTGHALFFLFCFFRQYYMLVFFCFVRLTKKLEERREQKKMEEEEVKRGACKLSLAQCFAHRRLLVVYMICQPWKKGIFHIPATIPYLLVLFKLLILLLIKFLIWSRVWNWYGILYPCFKVNVLWCECSPIFLHFAFKPQ